MTLDQAETVVTAYNKMRSLQKTEIPTSMDYEELVENWNSLKQLAGKMDDQFKADLASNISSAISSVIRSHYIANSEIIKNS